VSPRVVLAALSIVGAALITVLVYVVFFHEAAKADLTWHVKEYAVGDPDSIRVTLVVDKAPEAEARCQVATFTEGDRSAGRLDGIVIPRRNDSSRLTELTVVVPTEKPATRAQISQCVLVDPSG
jgi:hypothetical protein